MRIGLEAGDHLDLAAPQAGGDLQRGKASQLALSKAQCLGDIRLGDSVETQRGLLDGGDILAEERPQRRGVERRRPHPLKLMRRPGQDHDENTIRTHDRSRRGAHRIKHLAPGRDKRLFGDADAQCFPVDILPAIRDRP